MGTAFDHALAAMLREETGYTQPVGGPFVRLANGAVLDDLKGCLRLKDGTARPLPSKPDGMAFDDDPHDTGGRTGMGILQREYDAYRRRKGLSPQDVWRIGDHELTEIYRLQYWVPLRCDELPGGIAMTVFDTGVNCGVGTGIKLLQRALGVKVDGHLGTVTLDAAAAADQRDLIGGYADMRRSYYRQIKTFWRFGKNWLSRTDRIERLSLAMVDKKPPEIPVAPKVQPPKPEVEPTERARPEPPASMASSGTGQVSVGLGGAGGATVAVEVAGAAKDIQALGKDPALIDIVLALMTRPQFWIGVFTVAAAIFVWIERRKKLVWGV